MRNSFNNIILEAVNPVSACIREILNKMKATESESLRRLNEPDAIFEDMTYSRNSKIYDQLPDDLKTQVRDRMWKYFHKPVEQETTPAEPIAEVREVSDTDSEEKFLDQLSKFIKDNGNMITGYQLGAFKNSLKNPKD